MIAFFHTIIYQPLLNALIFIYNTMSWQDMGIAIILLTVFVRIVLMPLFYKGAKDQAILQRLAPKIKKIQKDHKHDSEKQMRAMMALYREHKVNPFSGFFLLLIQLPILISLYFLFARGLTPESFPEIYSFITHPDRLNLMFLGVIDLAKKSFLLALLAATAQYFQGKLSLAKRTTTAGEENALERMGRQMVVMLPVITFVILYFAGFPSAVALYWLTTSVFSVIQQIVVNKRVAEQFPAEA